MTLDTRFTPSYYGHTLLKVHHQLSSSCGFIICNHHVTHVIEPMHTSKIL